MIALMKQAQYIPSLPKENVEIGSATSSVAKSVNLEAFTAPRNANQENKI